MDRRLERTLSSTNLRKNYRDWTVSCDMFMSIKEFQQFFKGWQAHHIIPKEVAYKAIDLGYINDQEDVDKFDWSWNCIMLPSNTQNDVTHLGSHPEYTDVIMKQIDDFNSGGETSFVRACMNYAYALSEQIREVHDYLNQENEQSVRVNDLVSFIEKFYKELKEKNLCDPNSDDVEE